ncbi:NUDIX domain-containing protein [Candidatus Woesearchaeota archaeon]|nr:NUDIX domain-containing protein [Candidatus Woesearchaeota archaeon]
MEFLKEKRPKVGVGVFVIKDGEFLLGKRKNAHGEGSWCLPGGHLEFNEELEGCSKREVMEEAGVAIKNIRFGAITNDMFKDEEKHYITIFMLSDYHDGEVRIMEPHKCEEWRWFTLEDLPSPLFIPMQNLMKQRFDPFKKK